MQLLIDRVLRRNQHNLLVVRVGFRRRSIPLVWQALPQRGARGRADQQTRIQAAVALLPPRVRIRVHGDSAFRSRTLFGWLRTQGYDARLGVRGKVRSYGAHVGAASGQARGPLVPSLPGQADSGRRRHRTRPVGSRHDVAVGEDDRVGPVNLLAWWERDEDGKRILHAVISAGDGAHQRLRDAAHGDRDGLA